MHNMSLNLGFPRFSLCARGWLAAGLLAVLALPAAAVQRVVRIEAPLRAAAGSEVKVLVLASTDAGNGEQVGFFHLEYSVDSGKTWKGYIYEVNTGAKTTRAATIPVGAPGSKTLVRARIAFRGGPAGDVDYTGAPLKWKDTWEKWASPPAKFATINVTP
jgi:hypothetical protein